jgi:7-cyano-7-deazaguanine synthase
VEADEPWLRIHAPLLRMTKAEIVREAVRVGVDLARTVSCYDPGPRGEPCGGCDACVLRAKGFAEVGIPDPALSASRSETGDGGGFRAEAPRSR